MLSSSKHLWFVAIFFITALNSSFAQVAIDLRSWSVEGNPQNGNWVVAADGGSVVQSLNGAPTFFVSPDTLIDATIRGSFVVETTSDDDFVGFVFGFERPNGNEDYFKFLLFDWKKLAQTADAFNAQEGFTLAWVDGRISGNFGAGTLPYWNHTDTSMQVLAASYSAGKGWQANRSYAFDLRYESSRIQIAIDSVTVFDVAGSFPAGRFGFYNYSQERVRYQGFTQNHSPVARDDSVVTFRELSTTIAVLLNDRDPDPEQTLSILAIAAPPKHGTANVVGDSIHYQPDERYLGSDSLGYVIADDVGETDTATVFIFVEGQSDSLSNGLIGEYYDGYFNDDFGFFQQKQPLYSRTDPIINFDNSSWNLQSHPGLADLETFSVRWRGRIYIPATGAYTFYLLSDDASYLFLGETTTNPSPSNATINNGGLHVPREVSNTISLSTGFHDILVVYGEQFVENVIRFSWANTEAGIVKQIIPASFFYLPDVASGLVAYFPFNGNSNDESGNGNHGALKGSTPPQLTADRFGNPQQAYFFNGSTSYIEAPNSPSLQSPTEAITIAAWINARDWYRNSAGGFIPIAHKSNDSIWRQYALNIRMNQEWSFIEACYSQAPVANANPILNRWTFVTLTFDEATDRLEFYLDGVLVHTKLCPANFPTPDTRPLLIGLDTAGGIEYLNGSMDDLRIYSRALSQEEILQLYHEGGWTNGRDDVSLKNGSFEFASVNPGSFVTLSNGSTAIEGWTVTGGNIDYIGTLWIASDGARSVDLNGSTAGSISQPLKTLRGSVYQVQFDMAGNWGDAPSLKRLRISAANSSQEFGFNTDGKSSQDMGWQEMAFEFIAIDTITTLTFSSLSPGPYGSAIDNVRIFSSGNDIISPAAPQNLTAAVEPGRVTLTWDPNTEPDLLRYRIYRSTNYPTFTLHNSVGANTTTFVDTGLDPNVIYFYRITAIDSALNESGFSNEVSSFVAKLADLEVTRVQAPPSASSGQPIQVNWTVTNIGNDGTKAPVWYDDVFLSPTPTFDPQTATHLGRFENFSALNTNEAYANSASFTLPRGISGDYYVFVRTDIANQERESNEGNNQGVSDRMQIALSPFPDLQVTTVTAPGNAFSGDSVEVSWSVQNRQTGRTEADQWFDTIFLSDDDTLDFDFIGGSAIRINETVLGVFRHQGALEPGASYTAAAKIKLPHAIMDKHTIFVFTDINGGQTQSERGLVYEYDFELNNLDSTAIRITLSPAPDLEVAEVSVPSLANLGEDVVVRWRVINHGPGAPFENSWQDRVYLSRSPAFNPDSAVVLAVFTRNGSLQLDSNYTATRTVRIPNGFAGVNHIFVHTDWNNGVFEYQADGNNISSTGAPVLINNPDLEARSVTIPSTANSGQSFEVVWNVSNNGPGAVFNMAWNDRAYLSRLPVFNPDSATVLGSFSRSAALHKDSSYTVTRSFTLPNGIAGDYYAFVETNWDGRVFENQAVSNNRGRSAEAMRVQLSPWADLQVDSIITPDSLMAGGRLAVTWTVASRGVAGAERAWTDHVYLSSGSEWNPNNATLLASAERTTGLTAGATYTQSRNITLPTNLSGAYLVTVQTDANNNVYEHTDEGNNLTHSQPVAVAAYPPIDLSVSDFSAPDSALSGSTITVNWKVTNIGQATTLAQAWNDQLYFSTDTQLDPNRDLLMANVGRSSALRPNESYTRQSNLTLANGFFGDYYLIIVSDAGGAVNDADRSNNVIVSPSRMHIALAPSPDLTITELRLPLQVNAGQPLLLTYTIANRGNGGLSNRNWYDAVYLSQNTTLDNADVTLAAQPRNLSLPANATYNDSVEVEMPGYASGTYFLIMKTDSRNDIYEHNAELNNIAVGNTTSAGGGDSSGVDPIDVIQPAPADLIVSDITIPANAIPGEDATISWTLKNIGENRATGRLRDAAYISSDTSFQVEDPVFGVLTHHIDLPPGGTQQMSMKVNLAKLFRADAEGNLIEELPGLTPGQYHALVRTDIRRNIRESNTANNTLASAEVIDTDVPELRLGVPVIGTLEAGKKLYYQVNVDADLDLRLKLTSTASNASNEIYVAYGRVPTEADYDFAGREPFGENQEVVVPTTRAGMYYVSLVTGNSNNSSSGFTLFGETLPFSVFDITPDAGGSGGRVTATIRGAGFRDSIAVYLRLSPDSLLAGQVLVNSNSVELKVRWNLMNVALGTYDVVLVNPDKSTLELNHGFFVESPMNNQIEINLSSPEFIRSGAQALYSVEVKNVGNTDIDFLLLRALFPPNKHVRIITNDFFDNPVHRDIVEDFIDDPAGFKVNDLGVLIALTKNIPISEVLSAQIVVENLDITESEYPINVEVDALTRDEFILLELAGLVEFRKRILTTDDIQIHPFLSEYFESNLWFQSHLETLFETWLLDDGQNPISTSALEYNPLLSDTLSFGVRRNSKANSCEDWVKDIGMILGEAIEQAPDELKEKIKIKLPKWFKKYINNALKKISRLVSGQISKRIKLVLVFKDELINAGGLIFVGSALLTCEYAELVGDLDPGACTENLTVYKDLFDNYRETIEEIEGWIKTIIDVYEKNGIDSEKIASFLKGLDGSTICTIIRRAVDPNDITGPAGFGDEHWIAATQTLPYTIHFENDSTRATAAAQVVSISQKLDSTLDSRSFRLGSFGFANLTFTVPENRAFYSTRLDVRDSIGVFVDANAGIDITTNEVFWIFKAVDPATGQLPVFNGFLPVNDAIHRGEGFVNYTIRPKREAKTGDVVQAQARIVFDTNEPIDTPEIFNTIDAVVPTSRVTALPSAFNKTTLTVSWSGADDSTGSQIRDFALYVSTDGNPFELFEEGLTDTSLVFSGDFGSTYRFFTIVRDNAGNVEAFKTTAEATVTLEPTVAVAESKAALPKTFELYQNYPNPFNPMTIIKYDLPVPSEVKLEIFDILGRRVRVLVDAKQPAGFHSTLWDGKTATGRFVATGVYFYRIEAKRFLKTRKMLLIR